MAVGSSRVQRSGDVNCSPLMGAMSLIHNERWKLTATALNGTAIAMMAAGFVAPIVAVSYGMSGAPATGYFAGVSLAWFLAAAGLHLIARAALGRLRE